MQFYLFVSISSFRIQTSKAGSSFEMAGRSHSYNKDNDQCWGFWLTMTPCPECATVGKLWWEMWHPVVMVKGGSGRREGHARAGEMKLNPVLLNASEMMRLLHFCVDLFTLWPCLLSIHYTKKYTFVVRRTLAREGRDLKFRKCCRRNFTVDYHVWITHSTLIKVEEEPGVNSPWLPLGLVFIPANT